MKVERNVRSGQSRRQRSMRYPVPEQPGLLAEVVKHLGGVLRCDCLHGSQHVGDRLNDSRIVRDPVDF